VHRCYLDSPSLGILYFFTFGLFLIGWVVDFCLIPGLVDECNARPAPIVVVTGGGAHPGHHTTVVYQQAPSPYAQYPPQGYPPTAYSQAPPRAPPSY
jgi:hypothetical protein